jgi:hypothetical protein
LHRKTAEQGDALAQYFLGLGTMQKPISGTIVANGNCERFFLSDQHEQPLAPRDSTLMGGSKDHLRDNT